MMSKILVVTLVSMGALTLGIVSAREDGPSAGSATVPIAPGQRMLLVQRVAYDPLVRQIQQGLNALGYNAGPVDGLLGGRTRSAIEAYQRKHDLLVTGQPSRSLLNHIEARRTERDSGATTAQADLITDIQVQLRALGYDVRVSGRLDTATQEAIRSYQREHQLLVTGQPSTALLDRLEQTVGEQQPYNELVAQIQSALRQRGYDIDVVSGRMDAPTETAIRSYQRSRGLLVTGEPSRDLLAQLEEGQAQDVQLSRRERVRRIQEALNARGYEAGPADGVMGPKTRSAIRTYQSDAGMSVTGQISPELLTSLDIKRAVAAEMGTTDAEKVAQPEETQAGQPTFDLRVSDDFSDGNYTSSPSWTVIAGDFHVQRGALTSTVRPDTMDEPQEFGEALLRDVLGAALGVRLPERQGAAAAALPTPIGKGFKITATLSGSGGDGRALVNLGTYKGNDAANGYRLVFDEQVGQQLKLLASTKSDTSAIASTRAVTSLMDGNMHTIEWVRNAEGQMTVSVDGKIVMEASDRTYQDGFDGFSFINGGGTWHLDSLMVYKPQIP